MVCPACAFAQPTQCNLYQTACRALPPHAASRCAFAGLSNHPKFLALRRVLLEKAGLPAFHGIVFARTREAVRSLARLIQDCLELQFLEVGEAGGGGGRRERAVG